MATIWKSSDLDQPHDHPDKASRVRRMFNAIAPTYQCVNTVTSFGLDRAWRQAAVNAANVQPTDHILDVGCGTGDLAVAFHRAKPRSIIGLDFAADMLNLAAGTTRDCVAWCQGDGLFLPFADNTFNIVCSAFVIRNFQNLTTGLGEMHRVLVPGGKIVILEFTMPDNRLVRTAYNLYFTRLLPRIGLIISRDRTGAYQYLPRSVQSFVSHKELLASLQEAGFNAVSCKRLTGGIVGLFTATK